MKKYVIGIDYGTLSARALLIDLETGLETAASEFVYPHAVMDQALPDGTPLEADFALQHPQDYLDALSHTVGKLLTTEGICAEEIIGIGIDFTACTMLPVAYDGTPLCFLDQFRREPCAYAKLWKHHGAGPEADLITALATKEKEPWLDSYGGKVSSEWMLPKILETYHKAPAVYHSAHKFMEAADWLVLMLTGEYTYSSCMAGYKGTWNAETGFPSPAFLQQIHEDFSTVASDKLVENVLPTGTRAGSINHAGAKLTGLKPGTAVTVPIIDAHAALPATGIVEEGKLLLIIGTSGVHIVMGEEEKKVPGICGIVRDGIIPGLVAYEAGQACVGDTFDWFVKNCVPLSYHQEAKDTGVNIFTLLTEKAQKLSVGESGLLALDWWNGNRTPYADYDLTGVLLGMTLQTRPEEIYRALIEATAYGTKAIVDLYADHDVPILEIYAAGGISQKNTMLMQIYADVLGLPIQVPKNAQSGAFGSAIMASVAGGYFSSTKEAADALVHLDVITYRPDADNHAKYNLLYQEYKKLSEYFAKENMVLKKLKELR